VSGVLRKLTSFVESFFIFVGEVMTQFLSKIFKVRVHTGDPDIEEILKLGLKIEGIIIVQNMLLAAFC
jgi:hypothetical protein